MANENDIERKQREKAEKERLDAEQAKLDAEASDEKASIADQAENGEEEEKIEEEVLTGSEKQLSFGISVPRALKIKRPGKSTVKFNGEGEFEVTGQYKGGDKIITIREATIEEAGVKLHRDRVADRITGATKKHVAQVDRTREVSAASWERIQAILDEEAQNAA